MEGMLVAMGNDHINRKISRKDYDCLMHAVCLTVEEIDPAHWNPILENAWKTTYFIISEKMRLVDNYNASANIDFRLNPKCKRYDKSKSYLEE